MNEASAPIKRRNEGEWFKSFQRRFRRARFVTIEKMIANLLEQKDSITILDVGGRAEYWNMLTPNLRSSVHVTIVNFGAELEIFSEGVEGGILFTNVSGNACHMPQYADRSFDLVHSNSVVEHVGSYTNMLDFASEIRRVGRAYYVQTPNYWFPVDPHCAFPLLHWLPDPLQVWAMTRFNIGVTKRVDFAGAAARLDGTKMISRSFFRALFPDAHHASERFGLIFVKSLIARRGA